MSSSSQPVSPLQQSDISTSRKGENGDNGNSMTDAPIDADIPDPDGTNNDQDDAMQRRPALAAGHEGDQEVQSQRQEDEHDGDEAPPPPDPHPERRRARVIPKPVAPTRAQREAHEVTHVEFMPWCEHCVRGKALNDPHRKLKQHNNEEITPMISMDLAFSKREDQEGTSPGLAVRDHITRVTFAHALPGKSILNEAYPQHVVDAVVKDIKIVDRKKCIFKSDQEPAMTALQERAKQLRINPGEHTDLGQSSRLRRK